jgi:predicted GNAT family N-acyltransferase
MATETDITVSLVRFADCREQLLAVRREVFVLEQGVPEEIEVDGLDDACIHALARRGQEVAGVGRMQTDGHIGRIAVRKPFRGKGVGREIMRSLVDEARRQGIRSVYLHSQTQACGFYETLGFVPVGEPFREAGIPHTAMRLVLG